MKTAILATSELVGRIVVAVVWDVIDPAGRAIDTTRRTLRRTGQAGQSHRPGSTSSFRAPVQT